MKGHLAFYTKTALAAAVLSLLSPIALPLGPIPLTLCSLAIATLAGLIGPLAAFLAVFVYLALGAVGVPVFSGYTAGFGVLFGPSVGFFVGYLVLALIAGQTARLQETVRWQAALPLLLLGELSLLCLGAVGYALVLRLSPAEALLAAALPFLLPALLKSLCAALLLARLRKSRLYRYF